MVVGQPAVLLEEVLGKLRPHFEFKRGVKDPRVYHCSRTGVTLLHHIDDIRCVGPDNQINYLVDEEIPKDCEIEAGPLESQGIAVPKIRLEDAILTVPDEKHARNVIAALGLQPGDKSQVPSTPLDLTQKEELDGEQTAKYRSAVGSAIYLSADRRDGQYATKELARRMARPRKCDWQAAATLAAYLQSHLSLVRVMTLDPTQKQGPLSISDSDCAGCLESRRSTDSHVAVVGGALVQVTTQTQPGLPATPDAELRGVSRAAREALFLHELAELDFCLPVTKPKVWSDSSSGIQAGKRIGPGAKLRHLEVCEFYAQGAVQCGKLVLRKTKGTENPGSFLTKHPKVAVMCGKLCRHLEWPT